MNTQNYSINQSNFSIDDLSPELQEKIIKETVLKHHKYKITPPSEKDKRWATYIKPEGQKRKYIKKTKEKDLYLYLYKFYTGELTFIPTLEEYFKELIKYKSAYVKPLTLKRNIQHWNKYYANSSIAKQKLNTISYITLEDFYMNLCNNNVITKREFSNMFGIINGIMQLAIRNDILSINPCDKVDKRLFNLKYNARKTSKTEVLYPEEEKALIETLDKELEINPNNQKALAIKLSLKTGLRISELAALKFDDVELVNECKFLNISRSDTITPNIDIDTLIVSNYKHTVVDHTKTNNASGNRQVILTDSALNIIDNLKSIHKEQNFNDHGYIFSDKYGRFTTNKIAKYLVQICKKAGIDNYSSHDIRRTYCSKAISSNNITIQEMSNQLGHTNILTTLEYIYATNGNKDLYNKLSNVLN